ncbi:MAG TPA: histidinol phosphatase [Verrucomicrobiales bacterium]|nr:histidinol phosphatase [Verrucomicrobiales bacterium]
MFADLHLHTRFSDGTYSPEELASEAARHGLRAISLTDHDTVEGVPHMVDACGRRGIEFIPGCELTAQARNGAELHILAYHFNSAHPRFLSELQRYQEVRQERIRQMVARLNELGVGLTADAVFAIAGCRAPGRPHIARALVQAGFCTSPDEAFDRYLKMNRPAWVPKAKMSAADAIALIHEAGGLAVMAHPGLNRSDDVIGQLAADGLDGIECYHSRHTPADSDRYRAIAAQHDLLVTGGSDCHGMNKGRPLIGGVMIPYELVEKLNQRARVPRPAPGIPPLPTPG